MCIPFKALQDLHRTGVVVHAEVGDGSVVIVVWPQSRKRLLVVPVSDGLHSVHVCRVKHCRVDGVLDHSLAVEMEVEADRPQARVELLPHMAVAFHGLKGLLTPVKVSNLCRGDVTFLLIFGHDRVLLHQPVEHPPVLSAASSQHRDFPSLLDDDVSILIDLESSLGLQGVLIMAHPFGEVLRDAFRPSL